jgi:hypothetical protein
MTDLESGTLGGDGATSRTEKAKEIVGQAGHALKAEAQSFASAAQDRVRAEAQKGTQAGAKTLGDFANAVRRAGDELSQSDQSPASRLVQQAAEGLESLSRNLADKDPGDLLNSVRDFGRKNPAAFIGGAVLVGLALGRFARASEKPDTANFSDDDLGFTESYEPAPAGMAGVDAGIDASLASNLGALDESTAATTASPVGVDDGTSGIGEPDATTSPHTGGR